MSLFIAGRSPLDEAAASILTHLLGKHGFAGWLIGYENVSRDRTHSLDVSEATMACISYHDLRGSSARLRYHIQRLKQRLPTRTPILVGIRPSEDTFLSDVALQTSIGADASPYRSARR